MSEISRFYGIVITMYFMDVGRHNMPHFHARYGEYQAVFSVMDASWLSGTMPKRQMRLVQAWAELHQEELAANWEMLARGIGRPVRIEGLR